MISGINNSAAHLMQTGQQRLDTAAQNIASQGTADIKNLTQALVSAQQATHQVQAGAKMLETADKMMGHVIDAFA